MHAHQTDLFTALSLSCAVLIFIFTAFALSIIRQQRRYVTLHRQTILSEIVAMENERARIAKDLHDDMGPHLSYIKYLITSTDIAHTEDEKQLSEASDNIDVAMQKLREIAANMIPSTLIRKGFFVGLRELCGHFNFNGSTEIILNQEMKDEPENDVAINLYRMISEVIQNSLKHAKASHILVELKQTAKNWVITCEDDGTGFNYEKILQESGGLGLRNIKSRTELIGGKLFVQSVLQRGTQYIFEIPIQNQRP